jgi:hypothetical protein
MPLELQVIRASEFVCLDADEQLDFAASKQALQSLAQACRKRGLDRAVLDIRSLQMPDKPQFTPTQLAALVQSFAEAGFGRNQRLAVLYKTDPHGGARTFAFMSRVQGFQVRAIDNFEEAMHWLSEEAEHRENETPVRITKGQSKAKALPVELPISATLRPPRPARRTHK